MIPPATTIPAPAPGTAPPPLAKLVPVTFADLPGWKEDDVAGGFLAFYQGCTALKAQPDWVDVCARAASVPSGDANVQRQFMETEFVPHAVIGPDGKQEGLITGYYEPLLRGNRTRDEKYRFPIYGPPDDLITVELTEVAPELKGLRLRGRLDGRKLIPYWSRSDIEQGKAPTQGKEILYVDDAVELFFLQIQGSGRVKLDSGQIIRIGYADQNGHAYRSIGRILVDRGELTLDRASMQGIKTWGQQNPQKLAQLLMENPSFVFFREMPPSESGPIGSLGVPLTAGRSIAVDPRSVPLGTPVFVSTTWPNSTVALNRLMASQDTGGAIRGAIRADYFWGFGDEAGDFAGKMRQPLKMWALLPRAMAVPR